MPDPSFFRPAIPPELTRLTAELLALPRSGLGTGFHRMLHLTAEARRSAWWRDLEAIKITGSKGKGSTSALLAAILRELGISHGLYTSPHLVRFAERIQVGGNPIPAGELISTARAVLAARAEYEARYPDDRIGAFEVFTALAVRHFAAAGPRTVVSEAGIGGRYDATRIFPGSVAALTSVELEHTALLGWSPDSIAFDKADLCPDRGTLVAGPMAPDLLRRLEGYCAVRRVELVPIESLASVSALEYRDGVMRFSMRCDGLDFGTLTSRLPGEHQAWNAALAVAVLRRWLARTETAVAGERLQAAVREALRTVEWPGRFHRVHSDPDVIVDVGHTPQSVRGAARTMRLVYPGRPVLLVTGVSVDKDAEGILRELLPGAEAVLCTRAHHKGRPAAEIADLCRALRPGVEIETRERIEEAVEAALARASRDGMVVLVAGGLFLAVEAAVSLQGGDPRQVQFY
jgi:dihydrofolate synthase/folylpolyglutamate synthase